jgi:hypothetical protein
MDSVLLTIELDPAFARGGFNSELILDRLRVLGSLLNSCCATRGFSKWSVSVAM